MKQKILGGKRGTFLSFFFFSKSLTINGLYRSGLRYVDFSEHNLFSRPIYHKSRLYAMRGFKGSDLLRCFQLRTPSMSVYHRRDHGGR